MKAQIERGTDIVKVVTTANSEKELDFPFLYLCSGSQCHLHRRIAPLLSNGLILCVPEYDELATPVQILLDTAINLVHPGENYESNTCK